MLYRVQVPKGAMRSLYSRYWYISLFTVLPHVCRGDVTMNERGFCEPSGGCAENRQDFFDLNSFVAIRKGLNYNRT